MSEQSPEATVGEMTARLLDKIDGRRVSAALLIVAVDGGVDADGDPCTWNMWECPKGQLLPTSIGLVEQQRRHLLHDFDGVADDD